MEWFVSGCRLKISHQPSCPEASSFWASGMVRPDRKHSASKAKDLALEVPLRSGYESDQLTSALSSQFLSSDHSWPLSLAVLLVTRESSYKGCSYLEISCARIATWHTTLNLCGTLDSNPRLQFMLGQHSSSWAKSLGFTITEINFITTTPHLIFSWITNTLTNTLRKIISRVREIA